MQTDTGVGSLGPLSAPLVGNGRALARSAATTSLGVRLGRADSISATVPATIGAAKLVPTLML